MFLTSLSVDTRLSRAQGISISSIFIGSYTAITLAIRLANQLKSYHAQHWGDSNPSRGLSCSRLSGFRWLISCGHHAPGLNMALSHMSPAASGRPLWKEVGERTDWLGGNGLTLKREVKCFLYPTRPVYLPIR